MSQWFHRNAIKATGPVDFALKGVLSNEHSARIAGQLRGSRSKLLELFADPGSPLETAEAEFAKYLGLLQGFIYKRIVSRKNDSFIRGFLESQDPSQAGKSKLRPLLRFRWTQSVQNGNLPLEVNDALFECLSMVTNMALWLTKHAAKIAGNDEVSEEQALQVHRCLRKAAGMFVFVKSQKDAVSVDAEKGQDLSDLVLGGYINQTLAEAQEVVVARAIEKGNAPGLVSALAYAAAKLFRKAEEDLAPLDRELFEKWGVYLRLKQCFYLAYAFAFKGEALLQEDKCGEAVRACRQGEKNLAEAEKLCQDYRKARGPKSTKAAQCERHLFFRRLPVILKRHLDKAERENGFIYHHKVPEECPTLDEDPKYGLVSPVEFQLPSPDALWAPHAYQAFDVTKAAMPDFSKGKKGKEEVKEVKEKPVYQTSKDPSNNSGCSIS